MKTIAVILSLLGMLLTTRPARAAEPPVARLVLAANTPSAYQLTKALLSRQPEAFLAGGQFAPGCLYLASGQRVAVPGLRYHLGQRVVEAQDSLQADSTIFYPLAALRGFDLGDAEADPAAVRYYRVRLVRQPGQPERREVVQLLSGTEAGPLVLACLPLLLPHTRTLASILVAGPGRDPQQPLLPLDSREQSLRHLLGRHAEAVAAYARANSLYQGTPEDLARLLNYYNQLVVATR